MAVCNLFNRFNSNSGNFMMFSQYVEDIMHNYVEGENYRVIPSKFVAFNIDYSKKELKDNVAPNGDDLNISVPKYFQNCFENACAYARGKSEEDWLNSSFNIKGWNPEISKNLFWNCMFDGELLHTKEYGKTNIIEEVVYYGDINMHSHNNHGGMGYGEIYCYIPTDAAKKNCQVLFITDEDGRKSEIPPFTNLLEGHKDQYIENYKQEYFYNRDFNFSFDDDNIEELLNSTDSSFNINTIVVLYSIFERVGDKWQSIYENIPLGMYFPGMFSGDKLNNIITKYVSTSYGTGTSYGLRICTRMSVAPNGSTILKESETIVDDYDYSTITQLMTAMNENLSSMMDVVKSSQNTFNQYKDLLSIFNNNKTNIPYVKDINGIDYWFVNGKCVSTVVPPQSTTCCNELDNSTIETRIKNLMDDDPNNDWTYIEDPNGCDCLQYPNNELAEKLGLDPDNYPDNPDGGESSNCNCDFEIADKNEIAGILNKS